MTRMANGGIVGYAPGGDVNTNNPPVPTMGSVPTKAADSEDIKRLAALYSQATASLAAAKDPRAKAAVKARIDDLKNQMGTQLPYVMQYLDSTNGMVEPRTNGMASGGIVGYATGGEIEAYLDSIGADAEYKSNLTPEQRAGIGEMLDSQATLQNAMPEEGVVERMAEVGRKMPDSNLGDRPVRNAVADMLNSPVARAQNETLGGVARGAVNVLQDRMSELGPVSQGAAGANEEATERRRTGIAETLQNAMPEEGVVERMAEVGRQVPGSNLGDRPVRDALMEGIASLAPPKNPGATSEAARQFNRAAMQARNTRDLGPSVTVPAISEAASSFAEGSGLTEIAKKSGLADLAAELSRGGEGFFSGLTDAYNTLISPIPEGAPTSYALGSRAKDLLTAPFDLVGGFLQPTRGNQLTVGDLAGGAEQFGRGALGMEPATDDAPTTTEAEKIITSAPEEPAYDPMKDVEAIANPNLRRAIEGAQAAPTTDVAAPATGIAAPATGIAAPTAEQDDEVAATQLASTVASNPTPQNMSRFESEISRLMERRESPVRALSSFLKSFSQARGGSMGQNLAIATTAMNAADDAMDKQIIALEQLRRADQISERDFNLKTQQVNDERSYREAMGAYYTRLPTVQKEIEQLRQAGKDKEATRKVRETAVSVATPYRMMFTNQAKDALGRGATAEQIQTMANQLFEEQVEAFIRAVEGPQNSGGSSPISAVQEGATATNAQGDKVVFTNGAWTPM